MKRRLFLALSIILIATATACHLGSGGPTRPSLSQHYTPAPAPGTTLRAASFNILTASNKEFPWGNRREAVAACLSDVDADIFGLQEALWVQLDYLLEVLPDYTCIGQGRDDGHRANEFVPVFFRTNRFVLKHAEVFWLSDTPEVPGSNTWGADCVRCATVAILIDRDNETSLGVLNTHFDHISATAREKSAELIRKKLPTYGKGLPWIVMGDCNTSPGSPPYLTLVSREGGDPLLTDVFAAANPSAPPDTRSFHGYTDSKKEGRIDWIFASPEFTPLAAGIVQSKYRYRYPSDHFAVWADLKGRGAPIKKRKPGDRAGLPVETVDER